jgi:hypothetical protein
MFDISKAILRAPIEFLAMIGKPFRFEAESALKNLSEHDVRREYNRRKSDFYGEKVFLTFVFVIVCSFLLLALLIAPSLVFLILVFLTAVVVAVDALFAVGRSVYVNREIQSSGTDIVPADLWIDTSLESVLAKHKLEREKAREDYKQRTGHYPSY